MSASQTRLSFWWLALLEFVAFGVTAALYFLHVVAQGTVLWLLPVAVATAGAIFILLSLIIPRTPKTAPVEVGGNEQAWQQHLRVGRQLLAEERYEDAARMFGEALKADPENWQACNYLGLAASRRGLYEEARSAYEKAVLLQPDYASAHFNLATALEKLGQLDLALRRWRDYIEVGEETGERRDLLQHAQARIAALEKNINRVDRDEV